MSFQTETTLKDGREVTVEWDGFVATDHTDKVYPVFTEPMMVTDDDGPVLQSDLGYEWESLEEFCTSYMSENEGEQVYENDAVEIED